MPPTTFQHVPLESPKEEIRLVQILPGIGDIRLTLQRHEFTPDLEYVALSYEWGTTEHPEEIHLNGRILSVRQNLYSALERLRTLQASRTEDRLFHHDAPRFWIDAICINQVDDNEKSHQVAMMGRIYRQAAQTIAWLGQDGGNASPAFQAMASGTFSDFERSAINEVCERSYFQRIWIVQEVVLSQNLHFVCGLTSCPWYTMVRFWYDYYCGKQYWNIDLLSRQLVVAKADYKLEHQVPLLQYIITAGKNRRCIDFRDTVYAFLGLLKGDNRVEDFEVDYQISLEGLLIRLEAYTNPCPNKIGVRNYHEKIPGVFRKYQTLESNRRLQWYWVIMEVLHCLSTNVVGHFRNLTAVGSADDLEFLLQLICWIVAGYGVDLFSILTYEEAGPQVTQQSVAGSTIETIWNRKVRQYSYQIGITMFPFKWPSSYTWFAEYGQMTLETLECRELLLTFNKNVQDMIKASDYLVKIKEQETSTARSCIETDIPASIERTVFANLLAHFFLKCFWGFGDPVRDKNIGRFINDKPGDADHLPKSLSQQYRMTIVEMQDGEGDQLPHDVLVTLPLEVTKIGAKWQHGSSVKSLTACLFRNGDWH